MGSGLQASTSLAGAPISFGGWYNLAAVGKVSRAMAMLTQPGGSNEIGIGMTAAEIPMIYAAAGGTAATASVTTAMTVGQWHYVIGRAISSTLRYISVLFPNGSIENNSSTTARAAVTTGVLYFASNSSNLLVDSNWYGSFAEVWACKGDMQPSSTALDNAMVRHIARNGPFSSPFLAERVIFYSPCINEVSYPISTALTYRPARHVNVINGSYVSRDCWNLSLLSANLTEVPHTPPISRAYYPTPPFSSSKLVV